MPVVEDADTIARKYLARCDADLAKIEGTRSRLNNLMNDKVPIVDILRAGINLISLARTDISKLSTYISGHEYELDTTPYLYAIDALNQQVNAFAAEFNQPAVTVDEAENSPIIATVLQVPDGDGIIIAGKDSTDLREIRMVGINAQEIGTEEGIRARNFLEGRLVGKEVEIFVDPYQPVEKYGRGLAVIKENGVNINQEMLRRCLAVPLTKYGRHKYVDHVENAAIYEHCKSIHHGYGKIKFHTDPSGASVMVDGVYLGKAPVEMELPVGPHTIQLNKIDCSTMTVGFEVTEGSIDRLFPLLKSPVTEGIVDFRETNNLDDCHLEVDGKFMGIMPLMLKLKAEPHKIKISKDGYTPIESNVAPVLGKIINKIVTLVK